MKIVSKAINKAEKAITHMSQETPAVKLDQPVDTFVKKTEQPKQSYIAKNAKMVEKYRMWIDATTIKTLEKLPLDDFLTNSTHFICKSVGIPKGTYPIIMMREMHPKVGMGYSNETNLLFINSTGNVLKKSRASLYSLLRHEIQHQKQNYDILRTEELGEKAIEHYTKNQVKLQIESVIPSFKDTPMSEIEKMKDGLGDYYEILKKYKQAQQTGTEAEFLQELAKIKEKEYKESYINLQKKIIEGMGVIAKDSKEAVITNKHFQEFLNETDINDFNSVNAHIKQSIEQEAYFAGYVAYGEYVLTKLGDKIKALTNILMPF